MTECLIYKRPDGMYGIVPTEHASLYVNDKGINVNNDAKSYIAHKDYLILPTMAEALKKVRELQEKEKPKEPTLGT